MSWVLSSSKTESKLADSEQAMSIGVSCSGSIGLASALAPAGWGRGANKRTTTLPRSGVAGPAERWLIATNSTTPAPISANAAAISSPVIRRDELAEVVGGVARRSAIGGWYRK